jgi:hypothetical protein
MGRDRGQKADVFADFMKVAKIFPQIFGKGVFPGIGQQQVEFAACRGFQKRIGVGKEFRLDDEVRISAAEGADQVLDEGGWLE